MWSSGVRAWSPACTPPPASRSAGRYGPSPRAHRSARPRSPERSAPSRCRTTRCWRIVGDLAIVATPPASHVDDAIGLLEAGYQVVVEAPLACTLVPSLIDAEVRTGRSVLYSEHLVASPVIDTMLADVGSLGTLTHLSARSRPAGPADVASGRRIVVGRRRTVRPRRPPGGPRRAHGRRGGRRTARVAHGRDHGRGDRPANTAPSSSGSRRVCWPRSSSAGNRRRHRAGIYRHRVRAVCCAPSSIRNRLSSATATRCRSAHRPSAGRHWSTTTATPQAQAVLDQHPHRPARAGHLTTRTPGTRRDRRCALAPAATRPEVALPFPGPRAPDPPDPPRRAIAAEV